MATSEQTNPPLAIDLFSGCGGLSEGLRLAGFKVVAAVEKDYLAVKTYGENHKEVLLWTDDIKGVDPHQMRRALGLQKGELDLLAGCPPCQGFSRLRTLNGSKVLDEPQNDLVLIFCGFLREFQPKAFMIENVPALQQDDRFEDLKTVASRLGYTVNDAVMDTADYGVPQRRKRLIAVGSRKGKIEFPPKVTTKKTVRDAIESLPPPGDSGDAIHDLPEHRTPSVLARILATPPDGGSRSDALGHELECHKRCQGFKDVYGRMKWDRPAPTITTGCFNPSKGRFLHPVRHSAITMREAALLQSFPPDYIFPHTSKTVLALQIGNALPPEFIRRHAEKVLSQLNEYIIT